MTLKKLTEKEIDQKVVSQADDDLAWGKPIKVRRKKPASLTLPAELAARAAFPRPDPAGTGWRACTTKAPLKSG